MKKNGQIILYYILSKAMFFGLGISFIIGKAKQNSWLAIILGYILGFILLHLFLNKKTDSLAKSVLGKIMLVLLIMIILLNTILGYSVQIINFYLPQTPASIITFSFFLVIVYGAKKGYAGFKRLAELLVFVGVPLTLLGWIGNIPNFETSNFYPLLYQINFDFIYAVIATTVFSISPILLILCNRATVDKKCIYIGYILGGINNLIVVLSTIGTLGITLAAIYRYPEYIAFKKISAFNIFERMENIFALVWLMDLVLLGILCVISLCNCFKEKIGIVLSFITSCLTIYYFIDQYQNTIFMYQNTIYFLFGIILIILFMMKKEPKGSNS